MLHSTTTLIETATVAGATASTGKTAVKIERNENGEATGILVNKKKAIIGTTLGTTATSGTYAFQEASYQNTIRNVDAAQAYVQSMSDEELERTLIALDQLEASEVLEASQQKIK